MSAARVCGTGGGGSFSKPGDPSNTISIQATPAFGGVDIDITYPLDNPHAVAFVNLYRSTSSKVSTATLHAKFGGSYYYDRHTTGSITRQYYWAEIVTINGTVLPKVGPASAIPRPMIADLIEQLTGQIDEGILANSLKNEIALIQSNKLGLDAETLARAASDNSLAASISETRAVAEDTQALIQQEVLARAGADEALVNTVNTLAVKVDKDIQAAIQQEQKVRADQYAALASQITTAQSKLGDDIASVQVSMNTEVSRITKDLVTLGSLYTVQVQANGLVGGFGIHNTGKVVEAGFDVDRFWVGRTNNLKRKPFIIEGGQVYMDEALIREAAIQEGQLGPIRIGKLTLANGTPVTTVGGLIRAEAIDAERLNVGSAATFSGDVSSRNYESGRKGWLIRQNGFVEFNEAVIRGNLEIKTLTVNGESPLAGTTIKVSRYSQQYARKAETKSPARNYTHTRSGEIAYKNVPKGSRLELRTNALIEVVARARSNSGKNYWRSVGGDGMEWVESRPQTTLYGAVALRFRVWVGGTLRIDRTFNRAQGSLASAVAPAAGQSGDTTNIYKIDDKRDYVYTIGSFTENLVIKTQIDMAVNGVNAFANPARDPGAWVTLRHNADLISGNLSRLG